MSRHTIAIIVGTVLGGVLALANSAEHTSLASTYTSAGRAGAFGSMLGYGATRLTFFFKDLLTNRNRDKNG